MSYADSMSVIQVFTVGTVVHGAVARAGTRVAKVHLGLGTSPFLSNFTSLLRPCQE